MLLYGKPVQDCIPAHKSLFTRDWHQRFQDGDRKFSANQARLETTYNRGTKQLPSLPVGTPVAIQSRNIKRLYRYGIVQEVHHRVRRYMIRLASGMVISHNRRFVRKRISTGQPLMPPIRSIEQNHPVTDTPMRATLECDNDSTTDLTKALTSVQHGPKTTPRPLRQRHTAPVLHDQQTPRQ